MKPIFLEIEGFNSFREVQKINFKKLTDKGLFGIFGPTGSGKSSILDAIIYALYGKLDREFINLNEDKAVVKYTFEIGKGNERKTYHIHRVVKRDKEGAYKSVIVKLYEIMVKNGEESFRILSEGKSNVDAEILEIIGLKQSDFTRAVVLPQGKFSEFLKINPRDRSDMLERLFGLQKYGSGLMEKIKREIQKNNNELLIIEGQLSSYQEVSEEALLLLEERYKNLKEEEKKLKEEKQIIDESCEKYKNIWQLQQELQVKEKEKEKYGLLKAEVDNKRLKQEKAQGAAVVRPYIDALEETEVKLRKVSVDLSEGTKAAINITKSLEEIKKEYEAVYFAKENEIPLLNKKEANLNQAIKLMEERKVLLEEVRIIEKEIGAAATSKEKLQKELSKSKDGLSEGKNKILHYDQERKLLIVIPEERQKINEGLELEKNLSRLGSELAKLQEDYKNRIFQVEKKEALLKNLTGNFQAVDLQLKENKSELKTLSENCPGDSNKVLEKLNGVNENKGSFEKNRESFRLKLEKEKQYSSLKSKYEILEKKLKIKSSEAEETNKKLIFEKGQYEKLKIHNYAGIIAQQLKAEDHCPVCGNIHREKLADVMDKDAMTAKEALIGKLEAEYSSLQSETAKLQKEFFEAEVNYNNTEKELGLLSEALGNWDIEAEKNKLNAMIEEYNNYKNNVQQWDLRIEKLKNFISDIEKNRNKAEVEKVKLEETIRKEKENIDNNKNSVKEKLEELNSLKLKYEHIKTEVQVDNFGVRYNIISEGDKRRSQLEGELQKLRNDMEQLDSLIKIDNDKIQALTNKLATDTERFSEKSKSVERYHKEINILSEGREPYSYQKEVLKTIQSIIERERKLKEALDKEVLKKIELEKTIAALTKEKYNLELDKEKNRKYLDSGLKEAGFLSMEEAKAAYLAKKEIEALQKQIKDFDDGYVKLLNVIEEIRNKLGGVRLEKEQWQGILLKVNQIQTELEAKVGELSALSHEAEKMKASLTRLKEVLIEKEKYAHKKHLLSELEKSFKGNKFVEFIAQSQLKYVTAEASKRLAFNTNEKYELKLTEEGEFQIKDNSSGGQLRSTNSLSGGELFLTSLSLALALSSHIQLKGSASLEFFFLDEGFGTLDDELLDTVMNSLEKLHSEKLSVGIISHVKELKERVPAKIIVSPSSFGVGSSISIDSFR